MGPGFQEGSHPCPACPERPLGEFLSWQLLLQVPVFCRPCGTGVGGTQGGAGPSVFLCLRGLLFHLHLVAATEGDHVGTLEAFPCSHENSFGILGHSRVFSLPPHAPPLIPEPLRPDLLGLIHLPQGSLQRKGAVGMDRDCLWEEGTEEMREWRKKEKEEGNQEKERGMRRERGRSLPGK